LCNNNKRQGIELIVGWTAQGKINCGIEFKICSTMFLYSKEKWIIIIGTGLQKIELVCDKEQDTTILNWKSDWQIKKYQVF